MTTMSKDIKTPRAKIGQHPTGAKRFPFIFLCLLL
jgi:hypothetical protein